jgi:hypothetical protein
MIPRAQHKAIVNTKKNQKQKNKSAFGMLAATGHGQRRIRKKVVKKRQQSK